MGPTEDGHVCLQVHPLNSKVFQLAAGSSSRGSQCLCLGLEPVCRVCKPFMVSNIISISKDSQRQGQSDFGSSSVANTTLVLFDISAIIRCSMSTFQERRSGDYPISEGVHHANRGTPTSHLAIVRQQCQSGGLSAEASKLLTASWRSTTTSPYESLFKKWDSWCMERSRDPIRGPIGDVANFLSELFQERYQCRSLNAYRLAISSVHEKVDKNQWDNPLSRLLKGAFNKRPLRSKYHSVWDMDLVLNMFRRNEPFNSLSLEDLTINTAMLFALTHPCRGSNLAALDLNNRSFCPEGIVFIPTHLSKQSRPSHSGIEFFFPAFIDEECLCPVATLKAYELKTKEFRQDKGENCLFFSFIGQHKAVSSSTIARWLNPTFKRQELIHQLFKLIQHDQLLPLRQVCQE